MVRPKDDKQNSLTLHFEFKSLVTLPNTKSYISDTSKETAKSYEKLQEIERELDKRIRTYEERGGANGTEDTGSITYATTDESLKKDARRGKVVSNEKKLRDHIFSEASENRAIS